MTPYQSGRRAVVLLATTALSIGCSDLQKHAWRGTTTALQTMCSRANNFQTVTADCELVITRYFSSMKLDGGLISRRRGGGGLPYELRFRAWKLNEAVFDLALIDNDWWLWTPAEMDEKQRTRVREIGLQTLLLWTMWTGDAFCDINNVLVNDRGGNYFTIYYENGMPDVDIECEIHRRTLSVNRIVWHDKQTGKKSVMQFKYESYGGHPFPRRVFVKTPFGRLDLSLRDVVFNDGAPASAFRPAKNASRLQ